MTRLLDGKRILVTGVVTSESIAYSVAESVLLHGGEVALTVLGRDRERAEAAAAHLPVVVPVLEVDLTRPDHLAALAVDLADRWGSVDGALHAVAFAPAEALGGDFLGAGMDAIGRAFHASTQSYAALANVVAELAPPAGGSIVGLDFAAAGAWPVYNWMGVCKAALEAVSRYIARDLGPRRIRSNLVAAGPIQTRAAGGIPDFEVLTAAWAAQSPLVWDPTDSQPVADAVTFLLSDLARMVTGEILHVDGGYHAMAAPLRPGASSPTSSPSTL